MVHRWNTILIATVISALALGGCEKKEEGADQEANTTAQSQFGQDQSSQVAQTSKEDLDQLRTEAQGMSESQLKSSAQQLATDYSNVKNQITQMSDQMRSGDGMIAGDRAQMQTQITQLRQNSQNIKDKYDVYASVAKQKGINLASIDEMAQQSAQTQPSTQDANQGGTMQDTNQGGAMQEPNSTGTDTGTTDTNMPADANKTQQG